MKTLLKISCMNNSYLNMKLDPYVKEIKFHLTDNLAHHIDGYWLFAISHEGLRRMNTVGTDNSVIKLHVDTDVNIDNGKLKISGIDEI